MTLQKYDMGGRGGPLSTNQRAVYSACVWDWWSAFHAQPLCLCGFLQFTMYIHFHHHLWASHWHRLPSFNRRGSWVLESLQLSEAWSLIWGSCFWSWVIWLLGWHIPAVDEWLQGSRIGPLGVQAYLKGLQSPVTVLGREDPLEKG